MSTIIKPTDLNLNKIQYSKPEFNSIPGQKLGFKRIRLNYEVNNDLKDFIIESPANLLSWGLVENRDLQTNALNGYQMAINLWSKPNKTEEEEMFVESINKICDHAVEHLVKNRESIERYDLEKADLKKFNPLYWKMEKGNEFQIEDLHYMQKPNIRRKTLIFRLSSTMKQKTMLIIINLCLF